MDPLLSNSDQTLGRENTSNSAVTRWVREIAQLCQPDRIFWCSGSEEERQSLTAEAVRAGVLIELNQALLPGCFYHRSNPNDVARVEQLTYICTETEVEAGPTNNWAAPGAMRQRLHDCLNGSMRGRTLYVVPYLMGPPGAPLAKVGVELTDSIYVVLSMRIMARMGEIAYRQLGSSSDFNRGVHGMLDVHPERRLICHFPQDNSIWSVGSAYGGNVLLGKKCLSLRIGSWLAQKQEWMAEHMLVLGVESPAGEKTFVAAAFPSACGKTNFAMLVPPEEYRGWKVWTVGDDIAWMWVAENGQLRAINPEFGYFGVVPGTNSKSNPNAVATIARDTVYTNVALLPNQDVWWEGKDGPVPEYCADWQGEPWTPVTGTPAAHPNSRFAAPLRNNPALAREAEDADGVPISAIIFGGRRGGTVPLLFQAFDWRHGVFLGATMASEMTAAATGGAGQLRRDPMAMLPFCGYHMGKYFEHWLRMGERMRPAPAVFHVNWFRKGGDGGFLWPGFGENMRVLKWVVDRCHGRAGADAGLLGLMPRAEEFDLRGMKNFSAEDFARAQAVEPSEWKDELRSQGAFFETLEPCIPSELERQRTELQKRLGLGVAE